MIRVFCIPACSSKPYLFPQLNTTFHIHRATAFYNTATWVLLIRVLLLVLPYFQNYLHISVVMVASIFLVWYGFNKHKNEITPRSDV